MNENIIDWLVRFDDRSLSEDVWVDRMLEAVAEYNREFNTSLNPKEAVQDYLKREAILRSKGAVRNLWDCLRRR